jgi:hypothetical protein
MIEFECPVDALKTRSASELTAAFSEPVNDYDAQLYRMGEKDTMARVSCNVGDCAIQGFAFHSEYDDAGVISDQFSINDPGRCLKHPK